MVELVVKDEEVVVELVVEVVELLDMIAMLRRGHQCREVNS